MKESELIRNPDGSIYHLAVLPEDVSDLIVTVGDPNRVPSVSRYFDSIEVKKENREFVIHTGTLNEQRITCMSTGMGTDNIDIVLNELDALFNVDLDSRMVKEEHTSLRIVRIGTSGSLHKNITVGSTLFSEIAIGLEGLMNWYVPGQASNLERKWQLALENKQLPVQPTVHQADETLVGQFQHVFERGITLTAPGFYAPQNRSLRLPASIDVFEQLRDTSVDGQIITNLEMETAGIYGLSKLLGHQAISINLILANRETGEFASNPGELMDQTIQQTLNVLCG